MQEWWERLDRRTLIGVGGGALAGLAVLAVVIAVALGGGDDDAEASDVADATIVDDEPAVSTTGATSTTVLITTSTTSPASTSSTSTSTSSTSSTTSTTIDPAIFLETLAEGDEGPEVMTLQRMLVNVTGTTVRPDGVYGPDTTQAVADFQTIADLPVTGEADHATRILLVELDDGQATAAPTWELPNLPATAGCEVAVVGDSLMAGQSRLHRDRLADIGCASIVDGVGGRSLAPGWQCRIFQPGGGTRLLLLDEPDPGNDSCAPSGLELLDLLAQNNRLGDIVVIALGTNDAGLFNSTAWTDHWNRALSLTGNRPVVFMTTRARAGSNRTAAQDAYSAALRSWCAGQPRCLLADWALTDAANDSTLYVDSVHLRAEGTAARAAFIRDAVAVWLRGDHTDGSPLFPTTTTSTTTTSTTTSTTSTTTTTSTTVPTTTTTTVPPTTTSTSTTSTSTSTSTTSSTSSTTSTTLAP